MKRTKRGPAANINAHLVAVGEGMYRVEAGFVQPEGIINPAPCLTFHPHDGGAPVIVVLCSGQAMRDVAECIAKLAAHIMSGDTPEPEKPN